jgi:hypothetical protein
MITRIPMATRPPAVNHSRRVPSPEVNKVVPLAGEESMANRSQGFGDIGCGGIAERMLARIGQHRYAEMTLIYRKQKGRLRPALRLTSRHP